MNVVIISTSDIGHGAGIAAYRLHKALRNNGMDSAMVVSEKLSNNDHVHSIIPTPRTAWGKSLMHLSRCCEFTLNRLGPQALYSTASLMLKNNPILQRADVVHFHNLHWNNRNLSLLSLLISKKKPTVWTMHDMWPITGHCFYPYKCENWRTGCRECKFLGIFPRLSYDTARFQWKMKRMIYGSARLRIITPSRWLQQIVQQSSLFEKHRISHIPNGINQNIFRPHPHDDLKKEFGITPNTKTLLFASGAINDERKGYKFFEEAVLKLSNRKDTFVILTVGEGDIPSRLRENLQVIPLGKIADEERMAQIYSLADICVVPSLQDNLPNMVLESMACQTPVVAFKVGGIPDMVAHLENGYLAHPEDAEDLARGIKLFLDDKGLYEKVKSNTVKTITENFSDDLCAQRHIQLYKELLEDKEKP